MAEVIAVLIMGAGQKALRMRNRGLPSRSRRSILLLKGIMEKRQIFRQTKKTPPPNLVPTDLEPPTSLLAGETIGMLRKETTKTTKITKQKKAMILREK